MAIDAGGAVVRSVNVAKLDVPTIEAVENDQTLTSEAGAVVGVVAVVSSLGLLFSGSLGGFISSVIVTLIGWWLWSWLAGFIAEKVFKSTTTNTGEMLRVCGYAMVPMMLGILGFIPVIGAFIGFVGFVWTVTCLVIGIRQAGELTNGNAVLTAVLAAIPWFIAMMVVTAIFQF